MIEKEFRELVSSLELTSLEKKDINNYYSCVKDCINDINSKVIKVIDVKEFLNTDYLISGIKEFNFYVLLEYKNKNLPIKLLNELTMHEVFNNIILNIKNNNIIKGNLDSFTFHDNELILNYNNYLTHFYFVYKKENIQKDENLTNDLKVTLENYEATKNYYNIMNKKYSRFYSILQILLKYRNELRISSTLNDYLMDSILLSYGLSNYEFENNIIDYLKVYCHAINDLLENKPIILNDELYKELKVLGTNIPDGNYRIIDISNKQKNLINNDSIKNLKALKTLITSKFPKDGKVVTIDCTPQFVSIDKTIEWCFKIVSTDITNHGGEYDYNYDNYLSSIYKAMLKGLQFIVKNKLGNNIVCVINNNSCFSLKDAFPNQQVKEDMNKLSYENQSRYANVLQYAKDFDLGIEYSIK